MNAADLRPARDFALQFGCKSRLKTLIPSSGIYGLRNITTNKVYVGSAVKIGHRCFRHREKLVSGKHSNRYLQLAWNKHGESSFVVDILEAVSDATKLLECEQYWIDWLQSYNKDFGYNARRVANSNLGLKFSDDTKIKMSNSRKGLAPTKGVSPSAATRAKLSIALIGRPKPHFRNIEKYPHGYYCQCSEQCLEIKRQAKRQSYHNNKHKRKTSDNASV